MNIHQISIAQAFDLVRSSPGGLSSAEAARRLTEYGANRIYQVQREPALLRLGREWFRFFSIILWIAAGLAFVAEWADPGQGMARVGYAVVAVILVSGAFSFWQEYRVERTLAALQKLLPQQAKTVRDGTVRLSPVEQLVVGDVVILEQGDNIPADCRLVEAFGARVNNATVTGESISLARDARPSQQPDLLSSSNVLLAGTSLVAGSCNAVVFATGPHTVFGKIAHLAQTRRTAISPLRKELAYLSRLIVLLAIGIAVVFFAIAALIGMPFWKGFMFAIGIIVAMVPEGLLPTLTLSLVLAAQRMAKRNVLIRNLTSVETLGSATVICTDKTGTLTENRMSVRELMLGTRRHFASDPEQHRDLAAAHRDYFLCANYCHDVKRSRRDTGVVLLGDPTEIALVEMCRRVVGDLPVSKRLDEVPFDSGRMRQAVVHELDDGAHLYCKGALETILPLCQSVFDDGRISALDAAKRQTIIREQDTMAAKGLRVLAFASRALPAGWSHDFLEQDLVFLGLAGLEDPPRAEVPAAIRKCRAAGIRVIMITGDHPQTALAIATQIGLVRPAAAKVITGTQLGAVSPIALQLALDAPDVIFARVSPDDKMRIVEALKSKNHVVAVTGDGVNDAPALKTAHIGIAMGAAGTDVAKEAADMVLLDDNFASIVNAVEEGRAVFQNIRKFLTYVLVHNVAELVPYLSFVLFKIPLALTPIQILLVDMGTDSLTALGLGVESPDPQAMRLPPRPQTERLMTLVLALRAYLFLGLIEAAAAMAAFFFVLLSGQWTFGEALRWDDPLYLSATTACLSAIVVMQAVNVFMCRSSVRSVFSMNVFGNRLILCGVMLEIVMLPLINYVPWVNEILGTAQAPPAVWLFLVPFAIAMLVLEELRKWAVRMKLARARGAAHRRNQCDRS